MSDVFCDTVYSVICSPAIWLGCEENSVKIFAIATVPRDGGGYVQGVWKITIFDLVLALFHKRLRYEKRIGTHMRPIERCCLQWPWMTPVTQILKARSCANLYLKFDGWLSLWLATFSFFKFYLCRLQTASILYYHAVCGYGRCSSWVLSLAILSYDAHVIDLAHRHTTHITRQTAAGEYAGNGQCAVHPAYSVVADSRRSAVHAAGSLQYVQLLPCPSNKA